MAYDKEKVPGCSDDLFCGVNRAKAPDAMTDLEKKHTPVITAPAAVQPGKCFDVTVEVGKLLAHPNEPGHFFQFVELYAGDTYLARMDFTPKATCPNMKVCVSLDHMHGKLRAFARCNLHGTWLGEADLQVG